MNIVASSQPLDSGVTNMRAMFAEIVGDLADRIISIETGKCYFVNGALQAADVKPSLSMDLGYCTINMRVYQAKLIVLLPRGLSKHVTMEVIKSLVNTISVELVKRDAELGADTYVSDDMTFALVHREFTPAASSFHTDKSDIQMAKRIFQYNCSTRNKTRKAAFTWIIKTYFDNCEPPRDDNIWFSDHVDIHVDLANLRIAGLSRAALYNPSAILAHFGVAPTIVYTSNRFGYREKSEPYLLPGVERKYIVTTHHGETGPGIKVKSIDSNQDMCKYQMSLAIERPESSNPEWTQAQFIAEFLKNDHDIIFTENRCQMCQRRQVGPFYIIEKSEKQLMTYTPVCRSCIMCDTAFIKLSEAYNICEVHVDAPFSTVSHDYGISQTHMELFESRSFATRGYARDDATFAFSNLDNCGAIESLTQYLDDIRARNAPVDIITSRYDSSCVHEV